MLNSIEVSFAKEKYNIHFKKFNWSPDFLMLMIKNGLLLGRKEPNGRITVLESSLLELIDFAEWTRENAYYFSQDEL